MEVITEKPDVMEIGKSGTYREDWNERAKVLGAEEAAAFGKASYPIFADYFAYTVARRLKSLLSLNKRDRVLDIGCGPCRVTKYVAEWVSKINAVDVSDEMLKVASALVPQNVELLQCNGKDLSVMGDECVDVAYSYAVFIHIPKEVQVSYIKEAMRILRPGGTLLLHVRFNQEFEHYHPTFSGVSFTNEYVDEVRKFDEVDSVEVTELERWDDVCIDTNTRRWLRIKKL